VERHQVSQFWGAIAVLGALLNYWTIGTSGGASADPLLSTTAQFDREVARERHRAMRRSIPFCVITMELHKQQHLRRRARVLTRLLHRNLRMTDHKAVIGPGRFGVLLVDTSESGGRATIERIKALAQRHGLGVSMQLRVHDPEGFDSEPRDSDGTRRCLDEVTTGRSRVEDRVDEPLISRPVPRLAVKRMIDIVGASAGLVVTSPIIVAAMVAIKWGDAGPPMYKQTREGYRGQPFTIYKLRTMVVNAEHSQSDLRAHSHRDGPAFKIARDPRVTRVGHFLRKTCIDELPQLWNVIRGEMSLVGPRPLPWHESRACERWHRRRLDVRPGLTCDWQIDKTQADSFDDWMRMDLRYIDHFSLLRDLRLIAKTIKVPLTGRGSE
jgi:lipopolysaccharide/colanic/teichoic acid biosynthesis glycosyltransferase